MSGAADVRNDPAPAPLQLHAVSKTFQVGGRTVQALQDVDLEARAGVITGLIGPDGAGKTTLMRLAVGLMLADRGTVETLGYDVARAAADVQAQIGYMPQRFGLYEDLSVQENLDLYADLHAVHAEARARKYDELLHMTGLAPFTRRLAGRLSGGMKQKLGLACTLLAEPRLLLLDEPTVGVDPVSRRELWAIVQRLVQQRGTSVLLSTAYLDEAERCHEVVLLHEGRVLGRGAPRRFSAPLRGRTYFAHSPNLHKRALQARLRREPGVLDAVVQSDHVRVVLDAAGAPPPLDDVAWQPVAPRFEDGFISSLHEAQSDRAPPLGHDGHGETSGAAAAEPADVISVHNLSRRFGDFYAVRELSFAVRRGEVFGLLGANGAGKTTTFRMLCGLLPPSAGTLQVAGVDLRHARAAARSRIGYMSQKFSLYGNLSVRENLDFFSSAYGLAGAQREDRMHWALAEFGLQPVADAPAADLSLGYKQRLALACALMHEPAILFLDEPTSGVDPLARREFWHRINGLADRGVTVMVTTHFMEEAEYCDRLAIMASGRLLALDTPAAIRAMARHDGGSEPSMEDAFIDLLNKDTGP